MISTHFLSELKRITETNWKDGRLDPRVYGFQFQPGTKWNPGLPEEDISKYEDALQVPFPHDFKAFLLSMNGTDLPALNIYGSSGIAPQQSSGVYSYPKDLEVVRKRISIVRKDRTEVEKVLAEQGFDLSPEAGLIPIFSHRYIVCEPNKDKSVVLSIEGTDAIVYGSSMQECLLREFVNDSV